MRCRAIGSCPVESREPASGTHLLSTPLLGGRRGRLRGLFVAAAVIAGGCGLVMLGANFFESGEDMVKRHHTDLPVLGMLSRLFLRKYSTLSQRWPGINYHQGCLSRWQDKTRLRWMIQPALHSPSAGPSPPPSLSPLLPPPLPHR